MDQAIYAAKAAENYWAKSDELNRVVLRLGAFHLTCTFCEVIGKRFSDAGIRDLIIKSIVCSPSTVDAVLALS